MVDTSRFEIRTWRKERMSGKKFDLYKLTEDIRQRNMFNESGRLVSKWEQTGLLKGLSTQNRDVMARLLENQCAEFIRQSQNLLGEASSISTGGGNLATSGDLRGRISS